MDSLDEVLTSLRTAKTILDNNDFGGTVNGVSMATTVLLELLIQLLDLGDIG